MAMVAQLHRQSSSGSINKHLDSGKYVRYTAEQVEALERVYAECPKPSSLRRQQLIRECPILSNIEPKQIKVWFQNRRLRTKHSYFVCSIVVWFLIDCLIYVHLVKHFLIIFLIKYGVLGLHHELYESWPYCLWSFGVI